jgi:hypothetical protein
MFPADMTYVRPWDHKASEEIPQQSGRTTQNSKTCLSYWQASKQQHPIFRAFFNPSPSHTAPVREPHRIGVGR